MDNFVENFSLRNYSTVNHFITPVVMSVHLTMLICVALSAQQLKVIEAQRDLWVIHGVRCDMLDLVVNYIARCVYTFAHTVLTQSAH